MRNIIFLLCAFSVIMMLDGVGYAFDFDRDDSGSGGMKVDISSFFNDDKEDADRSSTCDRNYDPEDTDYKVDIIGRKVPVKTKKAGTAIETR